MGDTNCNTFQDIILVILRLRFYIPAMNGIEGNELHRYDSLTHGAKSKLYSVYYIDNISFGCKNSVTDAGIEPAIS